MSASPALGLVRLPKSAKLGDGLADLEAAVGALHAQRLDRSRPLWRFHLFEVQLLDMYSPVAKRAGA